MATPSEPRYALSHGVHIAYQTLGEGPVDLVYTPGIWSNLDVMWEWPAWSRYLHRLASFSRLITFDLRGIGLSDRGPEPPIVEVQADDIGAVMDAAGSASAVVFGGARGGSIAMLYAASHPERVRALILYGATARVIRAPDWPFGLSREEQQRFYERFAAEMGTAANLALQAPSADAEFARFWARFERLSASPGDWREIAEILGQIDVRDVLAHINVPTLILQRRGDRIVDVEQARHLATRIPNASYVELDGVDHLPFVGDADRLVDEIEEFVTGSKAAATPSRYLTTLLVSDIVDSTASLRSVGDQRWRDTLDAHHRVVRAALARHRGHEVTTTGDGFLATFDGPGRAVACGLAVVDAVRALGVEVRVGVHTGEVEVMGDDIGGLAVHLAARVASAADAGQVLVTRTVVDLVAGSGLTFEDRGERVLKGIESPWRLFSASAGTARSLEPGR